MGQLTHQEIEELLGAYALDAVDPSEADLVDLHLRECPRCRAEVAEHREVAASLAHTGSVAPPGLWTRIAGDLEEAPPKLDLARVVGLRPPARRSVSVQIAAAVAAVAAAVIAVLGTQVVRQDQRIDQLATAMGREGIDEAVEAAFIDDGARKVEMRSSDGKLSADAVVRPSGEAYLVRHNLPALPDDQTYQLWAQVEERLVSVGVLGSDPGKSAFRVAPQDVTLLALTAEQAGGVVSSTNAPVVKGSVPA